MIASPSRCASQEGPSAGWRHLLRAPAQARPGIRFHLVGIGGSGLSAIAALLLGMGFSVSGSDQAAGEVLADLAAHNATVHAGHRAENVAGADLVLISSAVQADNPEVKAAQAASIPVVKRSAFLGALLAGQGPAIGVAGTHGKTSTTAMLALTLWRGGLDPSFIVGGRLPELSLAGSAARAGHGPFVIEADEYDRMFLGLPLQMAIVTNVDWDHVDCYPTPAAYADAFEQFVGQLPASGHLVLSADGAGAAALRPAAGCEVSTYGLRADADWRAREVSVNDKGGLSTVVDHNGVQVAHLALAVAGQHNLCNALAAMAAADLCGVPAPAAAEILGTYRGAGRRFELVGEADGIAVIDDYGHHPTELAAVLAAARLRYPDRRLWAVFQPHTYSRLRALLPAFAASLAQADRVVLLDIYAAREADDGTVHSRQLLDLMPSPGAVHYAGTAEAAATYLLAEVRPGDVVITFSAGDGNQAGRQLLEGLRARGGQSSPPTRMRAEALQEEGEKAKGRKRPLPPSFSSTSPRSCPGEAFARPAMRCEERMDLAAALAALGAPAVADEPLARHTTFRIGGPAELFVTAGDSQRLLALARLATEHHWPVTVLGGGSNVLVSDDGIPGLVIASAARGVRELTEDGLPGFVADAGVPLAGLARRAIHHGWSGLEWAVCIPGTVGGAVIGNAGAHGGQVSDALDWAEIGWPDGRRERWQAADLRLGYRTSALKERLGAQEPAPIVLAAAFRLDHGDASALRLRADECLAQRRATQPVEPSAGSAFRNPPGDHAGRLIEACGLRGARLGGAQVSDRHANFIINTGTATAGEVAALIEKIRDSVRGKFALELQPEILFLGQWTLKP